jgi:hypothetical protein
VLYGNCCGPAAAHGGFHHLSFAPLHPSLEVHCQLLCSPALRALLACMLCGWWFATAAVSLHSSSAARALQYVLQPSGRQPSCGMCVACCLTACCCMMLSLAFHNTPGCPIGCVRCHQHFWEALAYCASCSTSVLQPCVPFLSFLPVCSGGALCVCLAMFAEVASPAGGGRRS